MYLLQIVVLSVLMLIPIDKEANNYHISTKELASRNIRKDVRCFKNYNAFRNSVYNNNVTFDDFSDK